MILIHEKSLRGSTKAGWLDSQHTFSFGGFNDPKRMGFGNLRVINEDRIIPGAGFAPHRHQHIDILTYVIAGSLRHEDDRGNVSIIRAGEAQLMAVGDSVEHTERNASDTKPAHFLQIWLIPQKSLDMFFYAQKALPTHGHVTLAGPSQSNALLSLRSNTEVQLLRFREGDRLPVVALQDEDIFVHIVSGMAFVESEQVSAGDGLQFPPASGASLDWRTDGEAMVFTMPRPKAVSIRKVND